jgi:reverse gyrase
MPLQDYLLPLENIKFYSKSSVTYGDKRYNVLVTDKRLILFAQRGHILRSDDIVSERLDRLQGVEYSEKGLLFKKAKISVHGASKMEMQGSPSEIKPLYQSIHSIVNIE